MRSLQKSTITASCTFHFQLKRNSGFFTQLNYLINESSSWNTPITHRDHYSFSMWNSCSNPVNIAHQRLPITPLLINIFSQIVNRPSTMFFPTTKNDDSVFQSLRHF